MPPSLKEFAGGKLTVIPAIRKMFIYCTFAATVHFFSLLCFCCHHRSTQKNSSGQQLPPGGQHHLLWCWEQYLPPHRKAHQEQSYCTRQHCSRDIEIRWILRISERERVRWRKRKIKITLQQLQWISGLEERGEFFSFLNDPALSHFIPRSTVSKLERY